MSLKKVTLASLILLGLTACGSSGNGNSTSDTNNNTTLAEVEKKLAIATDELKNLKVENQENTEVLEKAKADLIKAQADLDTVKKDKNATASALLEAQNKLKVAEENKERVTSELNAQIAKLNNEIEQIRNESSLANTNLVKAQADLKVAQEDKTKTAAELTAAQEKLKEAETAKATVDNKLAGKQRVIDAIHSQILRLEDKYYDVGWKHPNSYSSGFHKTAYIHISPAVDDVGDGILTGDQYIYKQTYSTVVAAATKDSSLNDDTYSPRFRVNGILTDGEVNTLPNEGSATYTGKAFQADQLGTLTYNVNFKERTGSGKLSGFDKLADITLEKGNIENIQMRVNDRNNVDIQGIKSDASMIDGTTGKYELGFFGPDAKEIAGEVYIFKHLDNSFKSNGRSAQKYGYNERGTMFGFGGTRGEIQK
ncbi:factor H binding protein domain-containing protein [Ursidibacter arcticus]